MTRSRPAPVFEPLRSYRRYGDAEMRDRSRRFADELSGRRTVRDFSAKAVPAGVLEECLRAAGSAPSGANLQPWHFVVIRDAATKRQIRVAAEEEERRFYEERAPQAWLDALQPLGTDANKPFLETAPCLIAIFAQTYGTQPGGERVKHYYASESVGIATGMLITALHQSGLASLTHTPSPMQFLNLLLDRPANERPFLLLVVGYPADDARVPQITRKPLEQFVTYR